MEDNPTSLVHDINIPCIVPGPVGSTFFRGAVAGAGVDGCCRRWLGLPPGQE